MMNASLNFTRIGRTAQTAILISALFFSRPSIAGDTKAPRPDPNNWTHEMIMGPESRDATAEWLQEMKDWRNKELRDFQSQGIDVNAVVDNPQFEWVRHDFVQTQAMAHDRYLFDPATGEYTVDRFLDDLRDRYGGIDSVLLWPTYPNLGIDDRNQYDLARDLPGGIEALKRLVEDFHQRGVRVYWPLNPWDNGTRDEGVPHAQAIAQIVAEIGADGFNGDTMTAPGKEYFDAGTANAHPLAIEPEIGVGENLAALSWTPLNWGYWGDYETIPGVDRYKWLQPKHRTHVNDRWALDRNDDLQHAWFNGQGYETWENVWSIWNGVTPRDAAVIRRLYAIARQFPELLTSAEWEPFTGIDQDGVFASKFPGNSQTLWTLVNRSDQTQTVSLLNLSPYKGEAFYDLWNGTPLETVSITVDAHGFGAVLATDHPLSASEQELLAELHTMAQTPLGSLSSKWTPLPQTIVPIAPTHVRSKNPTGMVLIPAAQDFRFKVSGTEIETEQPDGLDVQYPWEKVARIDHDQKISIPAFYIDVEPVSNFDYARFLKQSHYTPSDTHNFLRDWPDWKNGVYPPGGGNRPVTWVSIEDARAYAAWAKKRLPHEWEWQYAAQGTDGRTYPWGNDWNPEAAPAPSHGRQEPAPAPNGIRPASHSPFGVQDLVGDVWQWTDEFRDEHTRSAVLRGGSSYQPQVGSGTNWYFPATNRLDKHGKYLLLSPSIDRSGSIGFRCVIDGSQRSSRKQ